MKIELKGTQTKTHCSISSSIGHCTRMSMISKRCLMFKKKLEYDWDAHAYERCRECLDSEIAEDEDGK